MFFHGINYWAVISAMIAAMAIGAVWYAPWAFGAIWAKQRGIQLGGGEHGQGREHGHKSMAFQWTVTVISMLISAFVLAALFHSLVVTSISGMLLVALCVWAGFAVPIKVCDYAFGRESLISIAISTGYALVSIASMALITGIWG